MALLLATCLSVAVFAATPASGEDAPRRVGSLDYISGEVTYVLRSEPGEPNGADTENWLQADFDQPVCQDMSLRTGALARARVSIGPDAIEMSDDTSAECAQSERSADRSEHSIRPNLFATRQARPRRKCRARNAARFAVAIAAGRLRHRNRRPRPADAALSCLKARPGSSGAPPICRSMPANLLRSLATIPLSPQSKAIGPAQSGQPAATCRCLGTGRSRAPATAASPCQNRRAAPSRRKRRSLLSMLPPPMTGSAAPSGTAARPPRAGTGERPDAVHRGQRARRRRKIRVPPPPMQGKSLPTIFCCGSSNPTKINSSKRLAKQPSTSRPRPPEPMTSIAMADGDPCRCRSRCGSRLRCLTTGRPIALAIGIGSNRGAGPGSTTSPGVSRRFIMAGGSISTAIGDGPRALSIPIRSMPRRSLPLSMRPTIPAADPMVDPTSAGSRSAPATITRHGTQPGPITS